MWEYRNGQWFNGPTPSPVGPPIGAAFWITDANGMRDFRTFDGTNTPAATEVIPTNPFVRNNAPARPYGNDDIAINKTPPLTLLLQERAALPPEQQTLWDADPKNIERIAVARRVEAGLPPNPVAPPVATVNAPPVTTPPVATPTRPRPQGIPGYVPPMTTSGAPLNQDRTNLFTPPSVAQPRQVNYTTQDMFTPDSNPTPLMQRFRGDELFSNPTGQILSNAAGNTFERGLLASIAEAMKNSDPVEAARAARVMGALSNPAIVANYQGPVTRNGPTDLISQAGAQFDQEREMQRLKAERAAWQAGDVENMNYRARSAWEAQNPQSVEGETEEQKVARERRDKGPNNAFMRRRFDGTVPRYPMGTNPFIRLDPNENQAINGQRGGIGIPVRTYIAPDPRYQTPDWAGSTARPMIGPPQMGRQYPDPYAVPVPLSPPGAPRRSVAPIGDAFSTTMNPFMRGGVASPVNPFVRRFARGTYDPDWYNKAQLITNERDRARYLAEQQMLKSQLDRGVHQPKPKAVTPVTPVVTAPRIPNGWRAIGTGGTSYDLEKYKNWAQLMGYDWREVANEDEYLQSIGVLPKKDGDVWKDNPPADKTPVVEKPPVVDKPRLNPQVIWYDGDVWKDLPSLNALNNTQKINPFSRLGSRSSYDPATETTIQSPEKMNAFTMMQIDRDPQQLDVMKSIYDRHGRNWEKEYGDAIRAAPMGNATKYVKTG